MKLKVELIKLDGSGETFQVDYTEQLGMATVIKRHDAYYLYSGAGGIATARFKEISAPVEVDWK